MKIFWNDWLWKIPEEFLEESRNVVNPCLDGQSDLSSAVKVVF